MVKRNFEKWFSKFIPTISPYEYYVKFGKVVEHVKELDCELSLMNTLIGSQNIKPDFIKLVKKYPEVLKCIPLLIAVRSMEIHVLDEEELLTYDFNKNFLDDDFSAEYYAVFMEKIGLFDLISKHLTCNLKDYALGIEVGLDSNARKNRGGQYMEDLVEEYVKQFDPNYSKQMTINQIKNRYNVDLSVIINKEKSTKKFDFVAKRNNILYAIEVNFYNSGGSKQIETARSYELIAEKSESIKNFCFMWITDGVGGWSGSKDVLKEAFDQIGHVYCIQDLKDGVLMKLR